MIAHYERQLAQQNANKTNQQQAKIKIFSPLISINLRTSTSSSVYEINNSEKSLVLTQQEIQQQKNQQGKQQEKAEHLTSEHEDDGKRVLTAETSNLSNSKRLAQQQTTTQSQQVTTELLITQSEEKSLQMQLKPSNSKTNIFSDDYKTKFILQPQQIQDQSRQQQMAKNYSSASLPTNKNPLPKQTQFYSNNKTQLKMYASTIKEVEEENLQESIKQSYQSKRQSFLDQQQQIAISNKENKVDEPSINTKLDNQLNKSSINSKKQQPIFGNRTNFIASNYSQSTKNSNNKDQDFEIQFSLYQEREMQKCQQYFQELDQKLRASRTLEQNNQQNNELIQDKELINQPMQTNNQNKLCIQVNNYDSDQLNKNYFSFSTKNNNVVLQPKYNVEGAYLKLHQGDQNEISFCQSNDISEELSLGDINYANNFSKKPRIKVNSYIVEEIQDTYCDQQMPNKASNALNNSKNLPQNTYQDSLGYNNINNRSPTDKLNATNAQPHQTLLINTLPSLQETSEEYVMTTQSKFAENNINQRLKTTAEQPFQKIFDQDSIQNNEEENYNSNEKTNPNTILTMKINDNNLKLNKSDHNTNQEQVLPNIQNINDEVIIINQKTEEYKIINKPQSTVNRSNSFKKQQQPTEKPLIRKPIAQQQYIVAQLKDEIDNQSSIYLCDNHFEQDVYLSQKYGDSPFSKRQAKAISDKSTVIQTLHGWEEEHTIFCSNCDEFLSSQNNNPYCLDEHAKQCSVQKSIIIYQNDIPYEKKLKYVNLKIQKIKQIIETKIDQIQEWRENNLSKLKLFLSILRECIYQICINDYRLQDLQISVKDFGLIMGRIEGSSFQYSNPFIILGNKALDFSMEKLNLLSAYQIQGRDQYDV